MATCLVGKEVVAATQLGMEEHAEVKDGETKCTWLKELRGGVNKFREGKWPNEEEEKDEGN